MSHHRDATPPDNENGFSLVELLVVSVVLGILAAIAIPTLLHQTKHGYEAQMKASLRTLAAAQDTFIVDHDRYGTIAEVMAEGSEVVRPSGVTLALLRYDPAGGFCLQATHEGTADSWFWDSKNGGLQPKGSSGCPVTTTGAVGDTIP